ncbi:MAG TPA: nuclear transport factor 2 family protein [Sphingomonadaceae bacterium]
MRRLISVTALALAAAIPTTCAAAGAAVSAQAPLTDQEIATIQQLCETASFKYALALDAKDPDALAQAFSEDGIWEVLGNQMVGRDAIRKYWQTRTADWAPDHGRLHSISNQAIDVIDRTHARGVSKVVIYFFSTTPGNNKTLVPQLIAQNNDEYARTAQGWKLKRRSIVRIADVGSQ